MAYIAGLKPAGRNPLWVQIPPMLLKRLTMFDLYKRNKLLNVKDIIHFYDGPLCYTSEIDDDKFLVWWLFGDEESSTYLVTKISDELIDKLLINEIYVYDCLIECATHSLWIMKADNFEDVILELNEFSLEELYASEYVESLPHKQTYLYLRS